MTRYAAPAALLAAIVVMFVVLGSGGDYIVHARFVDAGQLVKGGLVEVAGREIGKVKDIQLTDDGVADIEMAIHEKEFSPLHRGTVARVRTVGLSGVANRFIEIEPGPFSAAKIPDGGVMTTAETRPIVDLDVVLDALDPPTRTHLQHILRQGAKTFENSESEANLAFSFLNPALTQTGLLTEELARDKVALRKLVTTGATTASTLAAHDADITGGITTTAVTLRTLAAQRETIGDLLARTPAVLAQARGTLHNLGGLLERVRPALREARPVTPKLSLVLQRLVPVSRAARPVLADVRALLPALDEALAGAPALQKIASPALTSTTSALTGALPVVQGLRPYTPDLIAGFFNGFGTDQAGYYDANGEYGRISLQQGQPTLQGTLGIIPNSGSYRSGDTARCPGGASEPADDKSNPWVPDPSVCDPSHDH